MGVALTGIGVVSPMWGGADAAAATGWEIPIAAIPADKRARIGRLDRLCRLMLSASYLAVDGAGIEFDEAMSARVGISFGTGLGCLLTNAEFYEKVVEQGAKAASPRLFAYTVSSAAAGEVSIALGIRGANATQHAGFAAGLSAVGYALDLIEMGRADIVLAGGGDACGPALVDALRDMGLLKTAAQSRPFVDRVAGIHPSEGAVVFVLERVEERPFPDQPPATGGGRSEGDGGRSPGSWAALRAAHDFDLAPRIAGYAAGFEPTLASAEPLPRGIEETMRRALAQSGVDASEVTTVITSAHGTPTDAAELAAIRRVFAQDVALVSPKAEFGEAFAASALLGIASLQRERSDGRRAAPPAGGSPAGQEAHTARKQEVVMVNSLCYSGTVVSLLLTLRE